MFKIGEFSHLCRVPVSALRYYADIGLLPPAHIDPSTGYRYYTAAQLPGLYRILALRDLDLSLEQIGLVLQSDLPAEQIRGMLRLKQAEMEQQVAEDRARLARVAARLAQLEKEDHMSSYDVVIKDLPAQLVASIRQVVPTYPDSGVLFDEIYTHLGRHGAGGLAVAIYHDDGYRERDVDVEAAVLLGTSVPASDRVRVYEMPAATVASTVHSGALSRIGEAYSALLRWIEANGYRAVGGSGRELYLHMNMPIRQDDEGNVIEVQFAVERA
jgi:DNA-binding transcriptional MerR regulator